MGTPVNQKQPAAGDRRLRRYAEIATIAGAVFGGLAVVIALLAWQWPGGQEQTGTAGTATPTADTTTSRSATATRPPGTTRFLTEMTPLSGQGNIEVSPDTKTFVLRCGSGVSDPSREVQYRLNGAYRKFEATVTVTKVEAPEDQAQLQVFADGARLSNIIIDGNSSRPISGVDLNKVEILTLHLTCERSNTVVTVEQARVSS